MTLDDLTFVTLERDQALVLVTKAGCELNREALAHLRRTIPLSLRRRVLVVNGDAFEVYLVPTDTEGGDPAVPNA